MADAWWRRSRAADPEALALATKRWRVSQRLVLVFVIAAFPFIFILDDTVDLPLSPVLPLLLILVVALVAAPFLVMEVLHRRARRRAERGHDDALRLERLSMTVKLAFGLAVVWFALWLAWGA